MGLSTRHQCWEVRFLLVERQGGRVLLLRSCCSPAAKHLHLGPVYLLRSSYGTAGGRAALL